MLKPYPVSANTDIMAPYCIRDAVYKTLYTNVLGKDIISEDAVIESQPITRALRGVAEAK